MQLRAVILYNRDGATRTVDFTPGALNVVTGESQTGKSALLTIVEYCLGRETMLVPAGPISDTVAWYGALWDLDGTARAFVGRPAPRVGAAGTSRAMLEFGGADLESVPFERLEENTDVRTMRDELGRRIGIEETLTEPEVGSLRQPLAANLGHAALLCLQAQSEIASQAMLFHRQGDAGIPEALRDTLPYFLGALPRDQALRRARLRDARRALQRADIALQRAEVTAGTVDVELSALLGEALAAGLLPLAPAVGGPPDHDQSETSSAVVATQAPEDGRSGRRRSEIVELLRTARYAPAPTAPVGADAGEQDRRRALGTERDAAAVELRAVLADRELLLDQGLREGEFVEALSLQAGRLTSLGLLDLPVSSVDGVHEEVEDGDDRHTNDACPACGQQLDETDTTAEQMRRHLHDLRTQLSDMPAAKPAQRAALERLNSAADEARTRLQTAAAALAALDAATRVSNVVTGGTDGGTRDFTRGRIDAILSRVNAADDIELARLRNARDTAAATVAALGTELDDDEQREQLTSRLLAVSRYMTEYAEVLQLEHRGPNVRIDLGRLTVVTDTDAGQPVPLARMGSGQNWVGYHLVTHLALHRYFARQNRPVPRLLMLDQPTQAYYPSEVAQRSGVALEDSDREAVLRIFTLLRDVVGELDGQLQVIVCDHANLPADWFQDAVRHNWRDGAKLIPADWIDAGS